MSNRTRAWRRSQDAKNPRRKSRRYDKFTSFYGKSWGKMYIRSRKLLRTKKLGKLWPRREYLKTMSESDPLNVLFVCSRNQWRSPTAETIFRKSSGIEARSAGTSKKAKRVLSLGLLRWADLIFVMEQKHKERMLSEYRQDLRHKEIYVLDIPDEYRYMDDDLVDVLKCKVGEYIEV